MCLFPAHSPPRITALLTSVLVAEFCVCSRRSGEWHHPERVLLGPGLSLGVFMGLLQAVCVPPLPFIAEKRSPVWTSHSRFFSWWTLGLFPDFLLLRIKAITDTFVFV